MENCKLSQQSSNSSRGTEFIQKCTEKRFTTSMEGWIHDMSMFCPHWRHRGPTLHNSTHFTYYKMHATTGLYYCSLKMIRSSWDNRLFTLQHDTIDLFPSCELQLGYNSDNLRFPYE